MEHSISTKKWAGYPEFGHSKRIQRQMVIQNLNEGVCQEIMRNKYLKKQNLSQGQKKPINSHFFIGLMVVKEQFLNLRNH